VTGVRPAGFTGQEVPVSLVLNAKWLTVSNAALTMSACTVLLALTTLEVRVSLPYVLFHIVNCA
jgi:hypothetical protein